MRYHKNLDTGVEAVQDQQKGPIVLYLFCFFSFHLHPVVLRIMDQDAGQIKRNSEIPNKVLHSMFSFLKPGVPLFFFSLASNSILLMV